MVERAGFEPAKPVRTTVLQTVPISHSGTSPSNPPLKPMVSPRGDSNPLTFRLQVGCAAIAPLGRKPGTKLLMHKRHKLDNYNSDIE